MYMQSHSPIYWRSLSIGILPGTIMIKTWIIIKQSSLSRGLFSADNSLFQLMTFGVEYLKQNTLKSHISLSFIVNNWEKIKTWFNVLKFCWVSVEVVWMWHLDKAHCLQQVASQKISNLILNQQISAWSGWCLSCSWQYFLPRCHIQYYFNYILENKRLDQQHLSTNVTREAAVGECIHLSSQSLAAAVWAQGSVVGEQKCWLDVWATLGACLSHLPSRPVPINWSSEALIWSRADISPGWS